MALIAGARLGPYEIAAHIGEGGMGAVYRARDTRLKRFVALKILPEGFASDPERLARFQREAEVLASLNHPHIAQIYGIEESSETHALVMELVEGPTLADKIAGSGLLTMGSGQNSKLSERPGPRAQSRRGLHIDEALAIAKQIAEALEAAHELGIIHRDLKPANIKVRPDGMVKVLDFGLAKAFEPIGSSATVSTAPTITTPAHLRQGYDGQAMTQAGVILGTAAHMSPEQARGGAVDRRADLWAFGVVLYEMLTGARLFDGATVSDTIAQVLMKEPDWTALPTNTPAAIRKLVRRCLEKDRKRRLDSAADARLEIEDALAPAAGEAVAAPGSGASSSQSSKSMRVRVGLAVAGLALAIAVGAAIVWSPRSDAALSEAVTRSYAGSAMVIWAPDGRSVAAGLGSSRLRLVVKDPTGDVHTLVAADAAIGIVRNAQGFTPDGQAVVFTHRGERGSIDVSMVSLTGSNEIRRLLRSRFDELTAEISPDGRWIAYQSDESGRHQVYVRPFSDVDRDRWLVSPGEGRTPVWSRDSRELFYLAPGNQLMAVPVTTGSGGEFSAGPQVSLFEARYYGGFFGGAAADNGRQYDVTPEGRFVMLKDLNAEGGSMRLIVVQRWIDELRRLVPADQANLGSRWPSRGLRDAKVGPVEPRARGGERHGCSALPPPELAVHRCPVHACCDQSSG